MTDEIAVTIIATGFELKKVEQAKVDSEIKIEAKVRASVLDSSQKPEVVKEGDVHAQAPEKKEREVYDEIVESQGASGVTEAKICDEKLAIKKTEYYETKAALVDRSELVDLNDLDVPTYLRNKQDQQGE